MPLKAIIHSSKYINLRKITTMLRKKSSGMAKNSCNFTQVGSCKSTQDKKVKLRKFATLKAAGEHQREYTDKLLYNKT